MSIVMPGQEVAVPEEGIAVHIRDERNRVVPGFPVSHSSRVKAFIGSPVNVYRDETEKGKSDECDAQQYFYIKTSLHKNGVEI
jgi:hypothetical protein